MTICVAVKVHDGLVFAADSASSLVSVQPNGQTGVANVYGHGNKVFNLYKGLPVCAMTCGMGNIGASSISTVAKDFRLAIGKKGDWYVDPKKYTILEITEKARKYFFEERFKTLPEQEQSASSLEFYIGGYGSSSDHPEIYRFVISNKACNQVDTVRSAEQNGVFFSGQPEALNRLVYGFSQSVPQVLKNSGVDDAEIQKLLSAVASDPRTQLVSAAMPTQDAILLADFLVETTKGFVRFLPGADTVGGETDIATVTRHEGFKWIRRKHYYPAQINRLETDHAKPT